MATPEVTNKVEELIQCGICLERSTDPRALPCQHTFCFACIEKHVGSGDLISCPVCRQTYNIPPTGLQALPSNFTVRDLREVTEDYIDMREYNILIMGETGVGKTMWINSIANYAMFETLTEAEKSELLCLARIQCTVDKDGDDHEVDVCPPEEEKTKGFVKNEPDGARTKKPVSYIIESELENFRLRLIDTPGIGDKKGEHEDRVNFDKTLYYLSRLKHLHGICILLKSNQTVSTPYFKYCFTEILRQFHYSVAPNIIFCFTHSRGDNYGPGQGKKVLLELLQEVQKTNKHSEYELKFSKEKCFCFDNEGFKYLAASHCRINDLIEFRRNYEESWNKSKDATQRLFAYLDSNRPHELKKTALLHQASCIIRELVPTMVDRASLVSKNIDLATKEKQKLDSIDLSNAEWKDSIYTIIKDTKESPRYPPCTICTNPACEKINSKTNTPDTNLFQYMENEYRYICHDDCNIEGGGHPNTLLQSCKAMFGEKFTWVLRNVQYNPVLGFSRNKIECQKCGCPWDTHRNMNVTKIFITEKKIDPHVQEAINLNMDRKPAIKLAIEDANTRLETLRSLQVEFMKFSAKFSMLLRCNSLHPSEDTFADYIEFQIKASAIQQQSSGFSELMSYKQILDDHRNEMEAIKKSDNLAEQVPIEAFTQWIGTMLTSDAKLAEVRDDLKKSQAKYSSAQEAAKKVVEHYICKKHDLSCEVDFKSRGFRSPKIATNISSWLKLKRPTNQKQ